MFKIWPSSLVFLLFAACNSGGGGGSNPPPAPPVDPVVHPSETDNTFLVGGTLIGSNGIKLNEVKRETVTISDRSSASLMLSQVTACADLLSYLGKEAPLWHTFNPYDQLDPAQTRWALQSDVPSAFYQIWASQLTVFTFNVERGGARETVSCSLPQQWTATLALDAAVKYPAVLKSYRSEDPVTPGSMQNGSKAGFAFVKAVGLGYQPRLAWALESQDLDVALLKNAIKQAFPLITEPRIETQKTDIVNRSSTSPVDIFAFSSGTSLQFGTLFVRPKPQAAVDEEFAVLMPYYNAKDFDFTVADPNTAITRNGKGGFDFKVALDAKTLKPLDCLKNGSASDPNSCTFQNKRLIHEAFAPLFDGQESRTCVLGYFSLAAEFKDRGGLVKVHCIDSEGNLVLVYNRFHKLVTEAIEALNGKDPRDL